MLLGRLRIWGKLTLLSVIPLVVLVGLTIPIAMNRIDEDERSSAMARGVRLAAKVGTLAQDLQRERLLAVGLLLGVVEQKDLVLYFSDANDRAVDTRADLGSHAPARIARAIDHIEGLADLRTAVLARTASPEQVIAEYGSVITALLDSLQLTRDLDTATDEGRQVAALDALLVADEAISAEATCLVILADHRSDQVLSAIGTNHTIAANALRRVSALATPSQLALRRLVDEAFVSRFGEAVKADPGRGIAAATPATAFPPIESFITLGNFVEKRIVSDVTSAADAQHTRSLVTTAAIWGLAFLIILVVLWLGYLIASSVARPLTRLTSSAERVAGLAERELVRVDDDEAEVPEPIRLDPTDIASHDEIGDLARAFNQVQDTAARLVERQITSRRNIAEMFGHIGRRTQNLVGRQVTLIDGLEQEETNAERLRSLYTLDHLSNRLRRNATSLVVLSGSDQVDEFLEPVSLSDVVRLALAEIEGYERVDLLTTGDAVLAPAVVSDLTLVTAELLENATVYSPPSTRVTVTVGRTPHGAQLTIVDQGIGMSAERMAEENARIRRRERLDLVPTQVLGLFVVGRLARRHRLHVALTPTTPRAGVTVAVGLGRHLLVGGDALPPAATAATPDPATPLITSVLRRADELIASGRSWNAFALPSRATAAVAAPAAATAAATMAPSGGAGHLASTPQVHPGQPVTATPAQPPAATPAQPPTYPPTPPTHGHQPHGYQPFGHQPLGQQPLGQQPLAPVLANAPAGWNPSEATVSPSGLRRRVPGANLVVEPVVERQAAAPAEADAVAVKALVEMFESGVAQALREVDTSTSAGEQT